MKAAKFLKPSAGNPYHTEPQVSVKTILYIEFKTAWSIQDCVTERELMTCSKFISAKQLSVLADALLVTADEEASIRIQFKRANQQAYQMLTTWNSKPHNKSRQKLLGLLNAADLHEAAKKWV